jgi:hypothetical protein
MRRRFQKSRTLPRSFAPVLPAPLPSVVVDAVLRFHDEVQDQGCGRSLLRLSPRRLRDAEVAQALGPLAPRAAGVSILWNEREEEIIRVLEAAAPRLAA